MSDADKMLKVAQQARDDWDLVRAISICKEILKNHADTEAAKGAQAIVDGIDPPRKQQLGQRNQQPSVAESPSPAESHPPVAAASSPYGTARGVATFLAIWGWLMFVAGFLVAGLVYSDIGFVGVIGGIAISFLGILQVTGAQIIKATVDNADHTRKILAELQKRNTD